MENTRIDPFTISASDVARASTVALGGARWDFGNPDSRDPADRCSDIFTIHAVVGDSWGQRAFVFAIVESYWPRMSLVFGDSFQDAYDWFLEENAEHLKIDESNYADYAIEEGSGGIAVTYTDSGVMVDTDNVTGFEVEILEVNPEAID